MAPSESPLIVSLPESDISGERSVREMLRTRGTALLRVTGGSMGPFLHSGDFVVVHHKRLEELSSGCVVVFAREGRLVIHRVLRRGMQKGERVLFTKGDAAQRPDSPVNRGELLGEVVSIERGFRSLNLCDEGRIVWSRFVSKLSPASRFYYPGAHFIRRLLSRVL
jgi:signal peptidase I